MSNDVQFFIFDIVVVIFSVIIHEISHGYVAERLGDPTARMAGRLTLNPVSHIDPVGSILVPALLHFSGAPMIGWAKPVPYNPNNLRDPIGGGAKIAAAGPLSNLILAAIFAVLIRFIGLTSSVSYFFSWIVRRNIGLAIFNLLPIPPLDGSKVLFALLPRTESGYAIMSALEQYGFFILIIFVFSPFGSVIVPVISTLFTLFTGQQLR